MLDKQSWSRAVVVVAAVGALASAAAGAAWLESRPDLATQWNTHVLASGLSVDAPSGWSVAADPASRGIEIMGQHGERLVVWQLPAGPLAGPDAAQALLARLASGLWPEAEWMPAQAAAPHGFRRDGRTAAARGSFSLTPLASPAGEVWLASLAIAPVTRARTSAYRFEHVLASLRFASAPAAALVVAPPAPGRFALLRPAR